jgi:uncharacterized membrane-anchored protein YhcB (DUF1043 family)
MTISAAALLLALVIAIIVAMLLWLDRNEIAHGLRHTAEELERARAERDEAIAQAATYRSQRADLLATFNAMYDRLRAWPADPARDEAP